MTDGDRLSELERINSELLAKNAELGRVRNRRITQTLVALIAVGIAITINILYVGYTQQKADQRWCALMTGLDDNYRSTDISKLPKRTQKFAVSVHTLRTELKCPATKVPSTQGLELPQPTDGD